MDKKVTSIVAYAGILVSAVGIFPGLVKIFGVFLPLAVWCVAYFVGDKNGAKIHLNQALVLIAVGIVGAIIGLIPLIGAVINFIVWLITLVFGVLGLISALKDTNKKLPFIGDITILK